MRLPALVLGVGLVVLLIGYLHRHADSPIDTSWMMLPTERRNLAQEATAQFYAALKKGEFPQALHQALTPSPPEGDVTAATNWLGRALENEDPGSARELKACCDQLQALGWAVEQCMADEDEPAAPDRLSALLPLYYKTLPTCPTDGSDYAYRESTATGEFTITCGGKGHARLGVAPHFPEYSSRFGLTVVRSHAASARLDSFEIEDVSLGWRRATVRVKEKLHVLGQERTATSTLTWQNAGDRWVLSLPVVPSPPPRHVDDWAFSQIQQKGLGESLLVALVVSPVARQAAGSSLPLLNLCGHNLQALGSALEAYASDHDGHYPGTLAELAPRYIRQIPTCPVDDSPYESGYHGSPSGYVLQCEGDRHAGCGVAPNFPRMDDLNGESLGRPVSRTPGSGG